MEVHFAPPELSTLDDLRCEALALPFFSDERPLRGALGLVDWRMCAMISKLRKSGDLEGSAGETSLLPARPKLPMDKVFLFGLGPRAKLSTTQVRAAIEHMLDTLERAGVRTSALCLPGRSTDAVTPADAMEAFVGAVDARKQHDELILLETHDAQRKMEPVIERERRRARAQLSE
ncbi:MAG: M17 family peptidase N-terminal domain-containing protein [Myxococcales bacterium]|jgi:leucyl aminopeptidase